MRHYHLSIHILFSTLGNDLSISCIISLNTLKGMCIVFVVIRYANNGVFPDKAFITSVELVIRHHRVQSYLVGIPKCRLNLVLESTWIILGKVYYHNSFSFIYVLLHISSWWNCQVALNRWLATGIMVLSICSKNDLNVAFLGTHDTHGLELPSFPWSSIVSHRW